MKGSCAGMYGPIIHSIGSRPSLADLEGAFSCGVGFSGYLSPGPGVPCCAAPGNTATANPRHKAKATRAQARAFLLILTRVGAKIMRCRSLCVQVRQQCSAMDKLRWRKPYSLLHCNPNTLWQTGWDRSVHYANAKLADAVHCVMKSPSADHS